LESAVGRIMNELPGEIKIDILDFACGTGRIIGHLKDLTDVNVVGCDISTEMISIAKNKYPNVNIHHGDVGEIFHDETFDMVTAFRFFLNAEDELRIIILKKIHQVLKIDGVLLFNIHVDKNSLLGFSYRFMSKLTSKIWGNVASLEEFEKILKSTGFEIVKIDYYCHVPRVGSLTDMIPMSKFGIIDKFLRYMKFKPQCFLLMARKI
jgi:ubiquinone/menaquinone biosynthesis C-methylase UbiE